MTETTFYADVLQGYPVIVVQDIAWGEMDAFQHVNNTVYFRYFENARLEYLRRIDWFAIQERTGVGPILHSTQARFRRPLTYPDTIAIGARVHSLEADRFVLDHRIVSKRLGASATEGQGIVVAYHYAEARKADLPEELRANIQRLEAHV